jgi:hypothetical protein
LGNPDQVGVGSLLGWDWVAGHLGVEQFGRVTLGAED